MFESLSGLLVTVLFLSLLFYLAQTENEAEEFESVLGKTEHNPEMEQTKRVVWEGRVGQFTVRLYRGNQLAYDDLSLLLKTMSDHDYDLRVEPNNLLRRLWRRPIETLFLRHREIETQGPLSDYMIHTSQPERARQDVKKWMNEPAAEVLRHFHHVTLEEDGTIKARWYPGYPVNEVIEKECYSFVNLLDQLGTAPEALPEDTEDSKLFS